MAARISSLSAIQEFLRTGAREAKLPDPRLAELDLLVEEAIVNVCSYAYPHAAPGIVTVTYFIPEPGEFKVEIADQGVEFNPLSLASPDLALDLEHRPVGGLGLVLLKTLARSFAWRRENGCNRLTFGVSAS